VSCYEWYTFVTALYCTHKACKALSYVACVVMESQSHFDHMSLSQSGNCFTRIYDCLYEHKSSTRSCLIWYAMYLMHESLGMVYLMHETGTVLRQCMRSCQTCNELAQYCQSCRAPTTKNQSISYSWEYYWVVRLELDCNKWKNYLCK